MKFWTLIGLVVVAMLGWVGYWYAGASAKEAALQAWLGERRAAGWAADAEAMSVNGFPNRFDTLVEGLTLADPRAGWAWTAPELRIFMVAYQPNRALVEWPRTQSVSVPGDTAEIASERMRASISFIPGVNLGLDRATVEMDGVDVAGQTGWTAALGRAVAAVWNAEESRGLSNAYDVSLDGKQIRLSEPLKAAIDPAGVLPAEIDTLFIDATAALDAPIDRHAVEGPQPALSTLSVRKAEFDWGKLGLTVNGRMQVAEDGKPEGEFDVTARNWRGMLDASVRSGLVRQAMADTIKAGLEVVSLLSGGGDEIDLTLRLTRGGMFLGPIPLGPAPVFPAPKASR
jgi:hypothetical protein